VKRSDGYAPLAGYAAIGDGVATALVALDGSIDWLCLPAHDSPSVFAAILEPGRGAFTFEPQVPYESTRRYLPETNVLETTFESEAGTVRVTDALTTQDGAVLPWRELVRRVEGLRGRVPLRWRVEPRFAYGAEQASPVRVRGTPVFRGSHGTLAVAAYDAGEPELDSGGIGACVTVEEGERGLVALAFVENGAVPIPGPDALAERLASTVAAWRRFVALHCYDGPWARAVTRSLLSLMLLLDQRTGAIVAAPTTSLPEQIGGTRNYDYRYSWPRDSSFVLLTLLELGYELQAHESLTCLLRAVAGSHPEVRPIYRLDGSVLSSERELPLRGYRDSHPVRVGNLAGNQVQLGGYGWLFESSWLYAREGNQLGPEVGTRLAATADLVCELWREPDSGIWELHDCRHYTQSKVWAWLALRRALELAELSELPTASIASWRREADAIRAYVETECWSDELGSYVEHGGAETLDAALLLAARAPAAALDRERLRSTVSAVRERLCDGPLVHRCERLRDREGAFVPCSFWLAEAYARCCEAPDVAAEIMEGTLAFANDVGLYGEEIDATTGAFLGNMPQGLSHAALVNAAIAVRDASAGASAQDGRRRARALE
jgi:GH15 family glucan-1,4-alpha-glucosidase